MRSESQVDNDSVVGVEQTKIQVDRCPIIMGTSDLSGLFDSRDFGSYDVNNAFSNVGGPISNTFKVMCYPQ